MSGGGGAAGATARAAVIGLGGVAAQHIAKLKRRPEARIVGICDLSRTIAEAVAERDGVGPVFTDHRDLLARARPHVVHVTTPPQTHREIVADALDAGAHVLVEKPIATSWHDYRAMRDHAEARGLMLVENHNYRFGSVAARALAALAAGEIGEVVTADVSYGLPLAQPNGPYADRHLLHFGHRLPGGALQNFATHTAYLLLAFMGDYETVRVWRRRLGGAALGDDELRALVTGARACGTITLTSHAQPSYCWALVRGTRGTLELDVYNRRLHIEHGGSGGAKIAAGLRHGAGYVGSTLALTARAATASNDYYDGLQRLIAALYRAVLGGGPPPVSPEEMDRTNRLMRDLFDPANRA